jgi:hypothetical protein
MKSPAQPRISITTVGMVSTRWLVKTLIDQPELAYSGIRAMALAPSGIAFSLCIPHNGIQIRTPVLQISHAAKLIQFPEQINIHIGD